MPFADYIRSEWKLIDKGDIVPVDTNHYTNSLFPNVVQMFNFKMNEWKVLSENVKYYKHIKYTDLLSNPSQMLKDISREFDINLKPEIVIETGYKGFPRKKKFDKTKYYLNKSYMNKYQQRDIEFIRSQLDKDIYEFYGYEE